MVKVKKGQQRAGAQSLTEKLERLFFSTGDQQSFLENLSTLIEDGAPANKAVEVLREISTGPTAKLAADIDTKVAQGRPIADGMVGWFDLPIVELVRAGEVGGSLSDVLRAAADALGEKSSSIGSLIASLTYPLTVIIAGLWVMVYVNHSILPQFKAIKPVTQWPEIGQNFAHMADFIEAWWWMVLMVMFALAFGYYYAIKNVVGDMRPTLDMLPGFRLYRRLSAARLMETLGLLISNGVVFKQALKILQHQAAPYLAWHLMLMERLLAAGQDNIAKVLDTGMIDRSFILRLMVTAEAKGFDHALVRLGKLSAAQASKMIERTGKITGGLLLATGALLAGFIVLAIYSVGGSLSN